MPHFFDAVFNAGAAGLTLTATVVDKAGVPLGAQPASSIVEWGASLYYYTTDAMPDGQRGGVQFKNGSTIVAGVVVAPWESENPLAQVLPGTYAAGTVGNTLARIVGLLGENMVIEAFTFDASGNMLTGRMRGYDTAAHATANDGATGLLFEHAILGVTANGLLSKGTTTRTS